MERFATPPLDLRRRDSKGRGLSFGRKEKNRTQTGELTCERFGTEVETCVISMPGKGGQKTQPSRMGIESTAFFLEAATLDTALGTKGESWVRMMK